MAASADTDGTVKLNGYNWNYYDKDDVNKTVTLGVRGSTSRDKAAISSYTTTFTTADIPWVMEINGTNYTVTKVGDYAFASCYYMTGELSIPEAVTYIGARAFWSCRGVTNITSFGGATAFGSYAFYYSNVGDCNFNCEFPDLTKVTSLGSGPFINCVGFTGEAKLNPNLTSIPYRCFENSGLSKITIPRTVTAISEKAFMKTKLTGFMLQGPTNVLSGTQTYATLNTANAFPECDRLKVLLFGSNTKGNSLTAGTMLTSVTNCTVFVPANGYWDGLVTGGVNNDVIYYGSERDLDLTIDEDSKTISATVATASVLTNIVNAVTVFKDEFGLETKINVTNVIEVGPGLITADVADCLKKSFDALVFTVNTQADLNAVLAAVPSTTTVAINPSGLTENLTIPASRKVFVQLSEDDAVRLKVKGFMIIVE